MIIVNGAGSELANRFLQSHSGEQIIAISREASPKQKNVQSFNLKTNSELERLLNTLNDKTIVWINFQAVKFDGLLVSTTLEEMQESFEVNYYKNFVAVKSLIPKMIKHKNGKFIFIDSVKAMMGDIGCASYAVSKGANRPLMQSIVSEYSRFNITCNTIAVGYADTPMLTRVSSKKRESLLSEVPGKKIVDSNDLNTAINFILQNDSVNGQIINLDGGMKNQG